MRLARMGVDAILLSEHPWIGGQMTSQAVPPDEHPWIEEFGCTALYRTFRSRVRGHYRRSMQITREAKNDRLLNPGGGWVSRLCCDPRVAHAVLQGMLCAPDGFGPRLLNARPIMIKEAGNVIESVVAERMDGEGKCFIHPRFILEASDTDEVLGLLASHADRGIESRDSLGEPHGGDTADSHGIQPMTWVAALGWDPEGDHTISEPAAYKRWRDYVPPEWPNELFSFTFPDVRTGEPRTIPLFAEEGPSWFTYRQVIDPRVQPGAEPVTLVNWPQNDLLTSNDPAEARELTLCFIYWLQHEMGYRGLRLRGDVVGTPSGLAQAPYIRETWRMKTMKTLREQDVSAECNPGRDRAPLHEDSVGVGAYRIDLHPRINGSPTLDLSSLPFQLPLGCLIPHQLENIIPSCKNIGVSHIANGCTRLHPVEWNIGESAAVLAAYCLRENLTPQQAYARPEHVRAIQDLCVANGIEIAWPESAGLGAL